MSLLNSLRYRRKWWMPKFNYLMLNNLSMIKVIYWEEAIAYFYWNQSHRYYGYFNIRKKQEEMSNQKRNGQKMKKKYKPFLRSIHVTQRQNSSRIQINGQFNPIPRLDGDSARTRRIQYYACNPEISIWTEYPLDTLSCSHRFTVHTLSATLTT